MSHTFPMYKGTNWPSQHTKFIKENSDGICRNCRKNRYSNNCVTNLCKKCCDAENDALFCPKHQLRRPLKASKEVKFSTSLHMLPPWLEYPCYPRYDIMWRMGSGETYWGNFWDKFNKLSPDQQKWYRQDFPDEREWSGVYDDMSRS